MTTSKTTADHGITEGIIWKQILKFFFPILLGTLFQTLYNTADAIIVGNLLGKEALAAVGGGTATAINLVIGFFTGIASGATVIISQYFGARNDDLVHKSIHNAWAIAIWGGLIISVVGYLTSDPLLVVTKTPEDIFPLASQYMHIYFAGSIIVVMYNIGAGIFRAFGDSKRPLYFLIVGCLSNIVLDFLFVGTFRMGVAGAAYATVLAQLISLVMVMVSLKRRDDCCKLMFRDIKFNSYMLRRTLMIGLPSGFQSMLYTISNLMIVSSINILGTDTVAAWAGYGKIDSIYWMINNSIGVAATTFVGQNYGAGLIDRAKKGVKTSFAIGFIATFSVEAILLLFSRYFYRLFVSDPNVIDIGVRIINLIAPFYFTFLFVEILSGAIRGTGKTLIPTLFTVFGIVGLRTLWLVIVSHHNPTLESVLLCYPITWIVCAIAFILYYSLGSIYTVKEKP
ncbi:MAG: MATE family efflux transporter [Spirochaetales bacterium]|nr:MATE family efflux transporter [Spirochaetales bacterium]